MYVHARAPLRIRPDERHLHRREVDDVRDVVVVERRADGVQVGHVAFDERHARPLLVRQHESKPRVVRAEVESDRLLAEVEERLQRPRTEAAESSGDERALSQAGRPGRR